jgi:hypothetical protein
MPQARCNTERVRQHGLGVVIRSFREVRGAVQTSCADLPGARARVS